MIESEQIFNRLEDIFFETLTENLDQKTLEKIEQNKANLFFTINESKDSSWSEFAIDDLEEEDWIEAQVTIEEGALKNGGGTQRIALMLLNLDLEDEKQCHIQWFNLP